MNEMDKIEMRFGQRVKELRLKQNISQEELAFRCGLSKNYLNLNKELMSWDFIMLF